jgi:hypothetical protein
MWDKHSKGYIFEGLGKYIGKRRLNSDGQLPSNINKTNNFLSPNIIPQKRADSNSSPCTRKKPKTK